MAPAHHPYRALLSKHMYEVPLLTATSYASRRRDKDKNDGGGAGAGAGAAAEGLDFEDFVSALHPVMNTIKERLCVMRTLDILGVANMEDGNVKYDTTPRYLLNILIFYPCSSASLLFSIKSPSGQWIHADS